MLKLQSSLKATCMAVAALTALGCSQDELVNQPAQKGNTTIVASFEGAGAGTRTSVKEENGAANVVWNKDDAFGIFYTSDSQTTPKAAKFSCPDADGTSTSATFTGVLDNGITTSYAVYPYDKEKTDGGMSLNGTTVTMTLPATLNYGEAAKQMASNGPMYASAADISQSLQFKHLAGLLKLTVSKGVTAEARKFIITADKSIAGTCTADLSQTGPVLAVTADGSTSITVTLPTFADDGQGNITTFYIPIPVGTYATLSAQLTGDDGKELYTPKEWTNVTVARAGMLTASFGYVKIDASTGDLNQQIANALPNSTQTPVTTNLQINGTIDATSGTEAIEIPVVQNSNINLELTTIPTTSAEKPLTLKDNDENVTTPADAKNTMTIAMPKVEQSGTAPNLTIAMPQTTVELDATDAAGTTYGKVIATTAKNTLVIKKGVTVNELVVKGGNVRVAGTVTKISKEGEFATTPYLIMETGATVSEGSDAFTVIDAAAYDLMMAVEKGGTCTLSSDIALTEPLVITKTMTLDLNGYSIQSKDNGSLKKVLNTGDALILVRRGASLTIEDSSTGKTGNIDGSSVPSIYAAVKLTDSNDETGENANANATLTVNSGTLKGYTTGISGNGLRHGTSITINGGIIGTNDNGVTGIYHPQDGTLTVNGGTITGPKTGIEIRSGKLEITNGIIKHAATKFEEASNGNGQTMAGAAVAVSQHVTDKELSITINGGELQGGTLYALYEKDLQNDQVGNITIKVTGGKFTGQVSSENCKDFIQGGDFNNFSAMKYLADNKDVTVTLDSDVSIISQSILVPANKKAILDLNGHIVTATNKAEVTDGITVKGDFTLKDSKGGGKIVADHDWEKNEYGTALIYIDGENAHMTMESGYIDAARPNPTDKGQYGVGVYNGGDFTMTGGKIDAGWFALTGNGNYKSQNSVIKIEGGELNSTADYAIYLPQAGTTTISGNAIITGACGGIGMRNGSLEITGDARITSKGTGSTGDWKDGTGNTGNAVISIGNGAANTYGDCNVTINGGTFIAEGNATVIAKRAAEAKHSININIIGGTFSDLSMLDYVTNNANIALGADINITNKSTSLPEKKAVILDLKGHTITADNLKADRLSVYGKLTLTNGNITVTKESTTDGNTGLVAIYGEEASMTLRDVNIDAVKTSSTVTGQFGVVVLNGGDFTMESGSITAYAFALSGNGTFASQDSQINITGGSLTSTGDYAIYLPQAGTTAISGSTNIQGACGGIGMRNGTLNITGNVICNGTGNTGDGHDGTSGMSNAVINVGGGNISTYGSCSVTINGGTYTANTNSKVIAEGSPKGGHTINIDVKGGTFTNFNPAKPDANIDKSYVPKGYEVKCNGQVTTDAYSGTEPKIYIVSAKQQ